MPQWIDTTIGKVRIEKQLAQGGMAEVYLGTHINLNRPVAIKVMHSFIEADEEMKVRFQREARTVAALRHPNIVQIYDFDTAEGHPYIVMEYIRGPSLATYLKNLHERNERMQPQHVARLLGKLASALDYAHEQGVIHRDIKPGNILLLAKAGASRSMFGDQIEPIITDFGLVRIMHATTQTASGLVSGTPAYISPEQAQGLKVDHRSDIYSLGVVLYEILAGRAPFEGETNWTIIYKHIHEPPPVIPNLQPALQSVIERALAKNPDDRYQTCGQLAMDYINAIGLIAEAATMQFTPVPPPPGVKQLDPAPTPLPLEDYPTPAPARRSTRLLPLLGVGFLIVVLLMFGISRLLSGASLIPMPTPTVYTTGGMEMETPVTAASAVGVLRFQDGTAPADQVTLMTASMPLPPDGSQYEAWLIQDDGEQRVSLGKLSFDAQGQGTLSFVDPQGRNLLGSYHGLEITVEPKPDGSPNPSTQVAYAATLPAAGFMHVRHLLYQFDGNPNKIGFIRGLRADTTLLNTLAPDMLAAYQAGDEAKVRAQAEAMLNTIVGKQSESHKDWNGDGTVSDPGDEFGLLLNGDNEGYIQGTFSHASLSMSAPDASQNMKVHGEHVKISVTNVAQWTTTLRDQLTLILQSPFNPAMEGMIRNAVALANQVENGVDTNGNENIEPIAGEGGARTAYDHAYYMADLQIPAAASAP